MHSVAGTNEFIRLMSEHNHDNHLSRQIELTTARQNNSSNNDDLMEEMVEDTKSDYIVQDDVEVRL
jgi:hypothetical protein